MQSLSCCVGSNELISRLHLRRQIQYAILWNSPKHWKISSSREFWEIQASAGELIAPILRAVMPGLVPVIHVLLAPRSKGVDGRKPSAAMTKRNGQGCTRTA